MIEHKIYRQYLLQYLKEALSNSNGTTGGVATYLVEIPSPGRFARHRTEKLRALRDLRDAFEGHRHWPLDIALSHLGVDPKELQAN